MTYLELLNQLRELSEEQLTQTVTVFLVEQDEYFSLAENFPTATSNEDCDQLDPDHFYLRV